jgi:hypothetical protein
METNKRNYPGFIDGLKASNIAINKTSLDEYAEQILARISTLKKDNFSPILTENLKRSEQVLRSSLNNDLADEIINYYIKFGDIFKSIIPELKTHLNIAEFKDIAINYLQIAKFSSDSRIKDLSISIAQEFD